MKKQYTALMVAFMVTVCMAAAMFLVSGSALMNKNGLPVADSPVEATATAQVKSAEEAQIQQLQTLVAEYQTREAQYQTELQSAGQQLEKADAEIRQYQMVIMALQNRGLIVVSSDGRISIP